LVFSIKPLTRWDFSVITLVDISTISTISTTSINFERSRIMEFRKMSFNKVDFSDTRSLYLQVADIIKDEIINKKIAVGQKLPPLYDFSKMFKVGHVTMREALSILVEEGYLSCRRNHGTFIISSEPKKGIDLTKRNEISLVVAPFEIKGTSIKKYDVRSWRGRKSQRKRSISYLQHI
jgi:DNA-binding transcriptional regulator YhcF (GntR family)